MKKVDMINNKGLNLDNDKMVIECGCKDCIDKDYCNGVDLMNCYIIKRLNIANLTKKKKRIKG